MRLIPTKPMRGIGVSICLMLFPMLALAGAPAHHPSHDASTKQGPALSENAQVAHVLNRLTYGPRPGDTESVRRMGVNRFIQSQLHPASIPEDPALTQHLSQLEAINTPPLQLFIKYGYPARNPNGQKPTLEERQQLRRQQKEKEAAIFSQATDAHITRALHSNRQLQEVMTEFWFNHFNIFYRKDTDILWIGNYEETAIRPYALGRFRDLLEATSHHPAMQFYLDNWQNSAPTNAAPGKNGKSKGLNENYARELMELHTLGVDGGYTQQDVIALAHILTGWGFPQPRALQLYQAAINPDPTSGEPAMPQGRQQAVIQRIGALINSDGFYFDDKRHDFADKQFLGYAIKGSGVAEGEQALDILARHPSTAKFISTQLAQYFVSDHPSPALVTRLSHRFLQTNGNIQAVLDTLFQSPEFWDPANVGTKYKTPYRYVISSIRAADLPVDNPRMLLFALNQQGMPLYGCETPNGYKYTQDTWLSPDGMTQRINYAMALTQGRLHLSQTTTIPRGGKGQSLVDSVALVQTLSEPLSSNTQSAILAAPEALRASLILSSPEFMKY